MDETEKTKARVQLAIMYERGDGVQRSFKEAAYWYKLAADDQHPLALAALGRLYARGRGVEQDLDAAIDMAHQYADGTEWVIYYAKAHELCAKCNTDNGEQFLEDVGHPENVTYDSLAVSIAYGEIYSRIAQAVQSLYEMAEEIEGAA